MWCIIYSNISQWNFSNFARASFFIFNLIFNNLSSLIKYTGIMNKFLNIHKFIFCTYVVFRWILTVVNLFFRYVFSRLYWALSLVYVPLFLEERLSVNPSAGSELVASVPLVLYISSFFFSLLLKSKINSFGNQVR